MLYYMLMFKLSGSADDAFLYLFLFINCHLDSRLTFQYNCVG